MVLAWFRQRVKNFIASDLSNQVSRVILTVFLLVKMTNHISKTSLVNRLIFCFTMLLQWYYHPADICSFVNAWHNTNNLLKAVLKEISQFCEIEIEIDIYI